MMSRCVHRRSQTQVGWPQGVRESALSNPPLGLDSAGQMETQ